jgi:2-oxoglutarate decarboxylase
MTDTTRPFIDFEELFGGGNAGWAEKLYADFLDDPHSVGEEWRRFFVEHLPAEALPAGAREPKGSAASSGGDAGSSSSGEGRKEASADGRGDKEASPQRAAEPLPEGAEPMRGIAAKIAQNMAESLTVPTATSTRDVPVKVLEENRRIINEHLAAQYLGKISFTHLIAWAMCKALAEIPAMAVSYHEGPDGKPSRRTPSQVNLGLAVDVPDPSGARRLLVPNVKDVLSLDFAKFRFAYDQQVRKARDGKLGPDDFADTTCTLTNPGTIGTISSLPRLMKGQAFIAATGAIGPPAEFESASADVLNELGVSKVMTLTSTYDHRVIQGADSGEFLALMHRLLNGDHGFYEEIFASLKMPYRPMKMTRDRRTALGSPLRESENLERAARVMDFIRAYRVRGNLLADLDPLVYEPKTFPELEMENYGLTIWDLDRQFFSAGVTARPLATLREIRDVLRATYTRKIGIEFMHMADPEQKEWLRSRMEANRNEGEVGREEMLRVLDSLVEAEAFERFLHTRFVGHKRFSLEGGESLVPALEALLDEASSHGVERAVIGMAHRGRLNVLVHVLGKPLTRIFSEFEGFVDPDSAHGSGDVKYHLGSTGTFKTTNGKEIALELASNPSHLEAVDPVVEGTVRARQDVLRGSTPEARPGGDRTRREQDDAERKVLPILIHGDAAFAGQGVVMETLNMSQLRGYRTGGTVHVIVNNQIGYTTDPSDARSTEFCTDVAKSIQAPIFHVNGDDPMAVVRMVRLAMDYRQRFARDAVVDIVCYRRHGHNEGDEPAYTQPLLYRKIENHPSVRVIFQEYLVRAGVLTRDEVDAFDQRVQERLKASLDEVRRSEPPAATVSDPKHDEPWRADVTTAVPTDRLEELQERLGDLPADFDAHEKIEMLLDRRKRMVGGDQPIDFGCAEHLAFASLLADDKVPIRLAGQDSGRGTFSQRHSVLVDKSSARKYLPLNHLADGQACYEVVDSLLSEEAALGFEYGYSLAKPDALVMWEAQFGDFCNGAQVQIDQFLAAGEAKWGQKAGLVMLLPHGYDGQGPEHSSARLERFLQLCAANNLRVANPSTAGQYFHLLRLQALDPVRKPLIVMTPKSLLRLKVAGSDVAELAEGTFQSVVPDPRKPEGASRVVLCSGKVYHDLDAQRQERGYDDVAVVRVELLYPWPKEDLEAVLAKHEGAERIWCQEEPANMGAWMHVCMHAHELGLRYVGRPAAASPATGSLHRHKAEQARLVEVALGGEGELIEQVSSEGTASS